MPKIISQSYQDAVIFDATLEHNGFRGGDSGHGGYVKMTFKSTTEIEVKRDDDYSLCVEVRGDAERRTLTAALRMIVDELESNKYFDYFEYRDEILNKD